MVLLGSLREESRGSFLTKGRRKTLRRGLNQGLRNCGKGKEATLDIIRMWAQGLGNPSVS